MTDKNLTTEERKALLSIARYVVEKPLKPSRAPKIEVTPALKTPSGAFVTVHSRGRLRGCIGTFSAENPLTETIENMAAAAAFRDPRFPPLKGEEIPDIDFEISVLTPMKKIDDIDEIEVGRHGIYITKGASSGVLLPQVATENGWDRDTFLRQTCVKAGLNPDSYKDEDTIISIFSAEVFGEKDS